MCGIASLLLYPEKRSPDMWRDIRETLTQNLLFNERRGESATGIAIIQQDGQITIYKQPICAHDFIKTPKYHQLLESLNEETTVVLGHTRRPTKGSPNNINNNHPLITGSVCGIHNGRIENDNDLFADGGFFRLGEVDSEIIFHLLINSLTDVNLSLIKSRLQRLRGKFTFLAVDYHCPHRLLVVKHLNPLSLHFSPSWNALMFSSSYIFLRKVFGKAVVYEKLANEQISIFDAYELPKIKHNPFDAECLSV